MKSIQFENWLDLKSIHNQLKDQYNLDLTTGLALDAGFGWDCEVLTGKSPLGTFYLYFNGVDAILDYNTEEGLSGKHWHPNDITEAMHYVVNFMEGKLI